MAKELMALFGMITTARSRRYTSWALRSFFECTPFGAQDQFYLIVNDGEFELEPELQSWPIQIRKNIAPLSFAHNGNLLMSEALAQNQDLVLLNNDIIFVPDWYGPVSERNNTIIVPESNNQQQHALERPDKPLFKLSTRMELEEYLGREQDFAAISAMHRDLIPTETALLKVICAPFFVVRIPLLVIRGIGGFDPRFGVGGGEDYDYCLRAWLSGYSVHIARRSFLLHFGGKSIEVGPEPAFVSIFRERWGARLTKYVFDDTHDEELHSCFGNENFQSKGFRNFISLMLSTSPGELVYPLGPCLP